MKRINVLCEGPTEEQFVQKILYPYFLTKNILLTPRSLDGGFNYAGLKHEIVRWLNQDKDAFVTMMIDLYGLKGKYPGDDENEKRPLLRAKTIQMAFETDIAVTKTVHNSKFIAYLQLHEFEALLFSDPQIMEGWLSLDAPISPKSFDSIRDAFESPEHINDSPLTAPSKRILAIAPAYNKVTDGNLIAQDIGLQAMRKACLHFDDWLTRLENL